MSIENQNGVPSVTPPASEPKLESTPAPAPAPAPAPGSNTPPENLFAALQEERRLRKEADERAKLAEEALNRGGDPSNPTDDEWSDEGKALIEKHVKPLAEQVSNLTEQLTLRDLIIKFPALKDKQKEFDEYRKGKPNTSLEDAAKLYLADNNLLTPPTRRKGLEEPRGGERTPAPTGMTTEDIADLRKNNYKKYLELLQGGKIPLDGSN